MGHAPQRPPRCRDPGLATLTHRRFLRIAPLSASVVGTSFAVHGLWAARWLADVEHFTPGQVLDGLLAMGAGLTLGSLAIGFAAAWSGKLGARGTHSFGWFCAAFILVEVAIQMRLPLPYAILWALMGGFGGIAVLRYSILDGMFPASVVGRANSALNVVHLTAPWAVQAGMGLVIARWTIDPEGHYPALAYQTAFAVPLAIQIGGLVWFILLGRGRPIPQLDEELSDQAVET